MIKQEIKKEAQEFILQAFENKENPTFSLYKKYIGLKMSYGVFYSIKKDIMKDLGIESNYGKNTYLKLKKENNSKPAVKLAKKRFYEGKAVGYSMDGLEKDKRYMGIVIHKHEIIEHIDNSKSTSFLKSWIFKFDTKIFKMDNPNVHILENKFAHYCLEHLRQEIGKKIIFYDGIAIDKRIKNEYNVFITNNSQHIKKFEQKNAEVKKEMAYGSNDKTEVIDMSTTNAKWLKLARKKFFNSK